MNDSLFADDELPTAEPQGPQDVWHVLMVDDEPEVHHVTEMVLRNFRFDNRKLVLISAYSGAEGRQIMTERSDIALAILDVVMEHEHAGLELARHIRKDLHNHYTRIVLRTGQPGQAPEEEVIREYDINDYKDKTELTTTKLTTLLYSSLRSYRDICIIDAHRRGLEKVIRASTEIFEAGSMSHFATAVLAQITNLLRLDGAALYCASIPLDTEHRNRFRILAATGEAAEFMTEDVAELPREVKEAFDEALRDKTSVHKNGHYVGYFTTARGSQNLLYVAYQNPLTSLDKQLLDIYAANVAVTYETLLLKDEILETQKELVYILGEAVEKRSKETGAHVKRVANISKLLALKYGLPEAESELIKLASPLHDVGKIGIPDHILNKPGRHTDEEFAIMKTHAQLGFDILSRSDKKVLQLGAIIAHQHHERWEGGGYPQGLKGTDIHIAGRITALADVFDALGSKRCYKEAWPIEKIVEEIQKQKGKHFDPDLVELMLQNIQEITAIRDAYPD
ncbi:MAG: DUF3369 domain-containing protein [Oceanospirillaceae bacterium]|nr:DUF3369 domain-containing protein [Oceanospirillaceae bacterium]